MRDRGWMPRSRVCEVHIDGRGDGEGGVLPAGGKWPLRSGLVMVAALLLLLSGSCSDSAFTGFGDACSSNADCDEGVCVGGVCQALRPPATELPPAQPPPTEEPAPELPSESTTTSSGQSTTEVPTTSTPPGNLPGSGTPTSETTDPCAGIDLNTDPENCGACGRVCAFSRGVAGCNGGVCVLAGCESGWRNCDGSAQSGCETPVTEDPTNCGECAQTCPAEDGFALCVEGVCEVDRCPAGQRVCGGKCEPANVCGGCADLGSALPDDDCGTCGALVCEGEGLVCQGETDLQTDPDNCGVCGQTCKPEEECRSGVCEEPPPALRVWIRSQSLQFGALTTYLQGLGYTVTRSQGGLFSSTLTNQDILVLDSSAITLDVSPTPQELQSFVNEGGSVIFIGSSSTLICERLNPYMDVFGMRFSDVSSTTASCSGGGISSVSNENLTISEHPVTRNASLNNTNLAQRNGWRVRDTGGGSALLARLSSSSSREVLRARQVGSGRVLVLADGRIATDMESSNQPFWRQAMEWLASER